MSKKGFTLAEVLITLTVIGIVAAMTIPGLVAKYQKKVYVAQLKTVYSIMCNGFKNIMGADGVTDFSETKYFNDMKNSKSDEDDDIIQAYYMKKYFKDIEHIPYLKQTGWPAGNNNYTGDVCKKYAGKGSAWYFLTKPDQCRGLRQTVFKLANGALIRMSLFPNGANYQPSPNAKGKLKHIVGEITIDVNGEKGPNTFGRDAFMFDIGQDGMLYPTYGLDYAYFLETKGIDSSKYYYKVTTNGYYKCDNVSSAGMSCAARIMDENWEMNY